MQLHGAMNELTPSTKHEDNETVQETVKDSDSD